MSRIMIDPYGRGDIQPPESCAPPDATEVATAIISYEGYACRETYWLRPATDGAKAYQLWYESVELPEHVPCCGRLIAEEWLTAAEAAYLLLRETWMCRQPQASSLIQLEAGGLLKKEALAEILAQYEGKHTPPVVSEDSPTVVGELLYQDAGIKYRGELKENLPHGKGTAFWENGRVWCEGSFRNSKPHGHCRLFFPSGALRHEGYLVDGQPEGEGTEYYENGRVWFEGVFGKQGPYYGYRARIWLVGRLYDEAGHLVHAGVFSNDGKHSRPLRGGG